MGPASTTVCSVCGEPLGARGVCFACLLRAGLDEAEQPGRPEAAALFDDFEIARREDGSLWELGRGAMGVTYRATEKTLHRSVALKVIELHGSEAVRERFLREARAAAALRHPNVAAVFRFGALADHDRCYCAMELIEGETLEALVRRDGPLKLETALEIAIQVTRALLAAAERDLVHRDLKPGNIMLTPSENSSAKVEVKVIDFGLAKAARNVAGEMELTRGEFVGTPAFASPEQFAGGAVDARTDIYALGVTLWFALTGCLPFAGRTIEEISRRQKEEKLPLEQLKGVPRRVIELLRSCLAINPQERPASARALMTALEACKAQSVTQRRNAKLVVLSGVAVIALVIAGLMLWRNRQQVAFLPVVPDKSIAVLPFENLSDDKANAYFADGIQDEILTRLSRIGDLKVISRTSTQHYKNPGQRNLRALANELGVANVVEGSVQRSGNRVRVNAQLIDARTDTHLWAQTYDREVADVFAIQSEVAKAIANQLKATLSPTEKSAIEQAPTTDIAAFDLYSHARDLFLTAFIGINGRADLLEAADLLKQAVARDPSFFQAWCQLAFTEINLYSVFDHTAVHLAQAEAALQSAARLRPDAGETHLARARILYWGYLDYDGALGELELARQSLPGEDWVFSLKGYIERRQGRFEEALRDLKRATELDPRNVLTLQQLAITYGQLRRYAEEKSTFERVLAFEPNDPVTKSQHALVEFDSKADTRPLHDVIDSIRTNNPAALSSVADNWLLCAFAERDPATAKKALVALGDNAASLSAIGDVRLTRPFIEGLLAIMEKDEAGARAAFTTARAGQEKIVQAQPNYGPALCVLALADAALGRKEEALREGRRAVELVPVEKDAMRGAAMVKYLAVIAAWVGEKDVACEQLAIAMSKPGDLSYGQLKLMPFWDSLRGDSRFEKIVADAAKPQEPVAAAAPAKSVAVLPFENRSRDPDNAFFTDGVQDEILTDLARVADLKVISRTSVMQYKNVGQRNLRQIANELGVANVVEGSVQRSGNRVRVNAQLIDARADAHLWGQTYDRDLADVFAIQSEIAKAIADQLQAKLSPNEKNEIEQPPTRDVTAFDFYSHAKNLVLNASGSSSGKADLLQAADLLNQAVARDPSFFEAYCQLAFTQVSVYFLDFDHTPPRLAAAEEAVQAAARLRPNAGETHLARARNLYWGHSDYDGALAELELARQRLPSDNWVFSLKGYVERRQGRWEESLRDLERAVALDPRNILTLQQTARSYSLLHRYSESKALLARVLSFEPNDPVTKVLHAFVELDSNANTRPVLEVIDSIRRTNPSAITNVANNWLICTLAERDIAKIENALAACGENPILLGTNENVIFPRPFVEGLIARMNHDDDRARTAFAAARAEQEKVVQARPNYGLALCVLGLIDAALGQREQALREGQRAVELARAEKDVVLTPTTIKYWAMIAGWVGDTDLACNQLSTITRDPSNVSYGQLKLLPLWDPLRGDPRFEKIVSSLAPE